MTQTHVRSSDELKEGRRGGAPAPAAWPVVAGPPCVFHKTVKPKNSHAPTHYSDGRAVRKQAEIMAASEAAKEAVYLGSFLGELEQHDNSPIDLRLDNKAAGDLAYNPEHHPTCVLQRHTLGLDIFDAIMAMP